MAALAKVDILILDDWGLDWAWPSSMANAAAIGPNGSMGFIRPAQPW